MSQPAHEPTVVPQPPVQAEAIRIVLAQVAPHLLPQFDQDRAAATARARAETSPTPLRVFAEAWAVEVAIARHPETVARLRELEAAAVEETDLRAAMEISAEISGIRRAAAAEAGVGGGCPVSDEWMWDYAFQAEDQASFPKLVLDEVKALAEQIVDLANLGINPAGLENPPPAPPVGTSCRAEAGSRPRPFPGYGHA